MRNQKKRFKNFEKVIIDVAQNGQEKELVDKVIQALNKNNLFIQKKLKLLGNVAQLQQLGLLLNGLNQSDGFEHTAVGRGRTMRMSPQWGVLKANELSSLARNEYRRRTKASVRRLSERNRIPPGVPS